MIEQIDNKRYKCVIVYCKVVIWLKIQLYKKIKWLGIFLELKKSYLKVNYT